MAWQGWGRPLNPGGGSPDLPSREGLIGFPATRSSEEGFMSRVSMFNSPLLLGFDQLERTLDRGRGDQTHAAGQA